MSYAQTITAATGVTDPADVAEIEDSMRNDIFHSTLDWQTKAVLMKGAREAWALIQYMRSPAGMTEIERLNAEMMGAE